MWDVRSGPLALPPVVIHILDFSENSRGAKKDLLHFRYLFFFSLSWEHWDRVIQKPWTSPSMPKDWSCWPWRFCFPVFGKGKRGNLWLTSHTHLRSFLGPIAVCSSQWSACWICRVKCISKWSLLSHNVRTRSANSLMPKKLIVLLHSLTGQGLFC